MSETSDSGAPVLRHSSDRTEAFIAPTHLSEEREAALDAHRERYWGPSPQVFHEIVSDTVHLDLWPHPALPQDGVTIVTQGASALPTPTPDGITPYFEVLTYVPTTFLAPDGGVAQDESSWWPGRMVKDVARMPHDYKTWLGLGHTLSFSNPPAPLVEGSALTSVVLMPPMGDEGAGLAHTPDGDVRYLWAMPITHAELELKLAKGMDALLDALDAAEVPMVCDPHRACSVSGSRKRGLFRRR